MKSDPKFQLTYQEIAAFINKEIEDPNNPLSAYFSPGSTKLDNFFIYNSIYGYKKSIDNACEVMGLDLRGGVSVGDIQQDVLQAKLEPVISTESNIIHITNHLFNVCSRFSKLLAKSVVVDKVKNDGFSISYNLDDYKKLLLENPALQKEWDMFFYNCGIDKHSPLIQGAIIVEGKCNQSLHVDIHESIMLFILGHEYGHHICQHSLNGVASSDGDSIEKRFNCEYEADVVSSDISMFIGNNDNESSLFTAANIGAICMLRVLDMIDESSLILTGKKLDSVEFQSHPSFFDRINSIKNHTKRVQEDKIRLDLIRRKQDLFSSLLDFIWFNSRNYIKSEYENGSRAKVPLDEGWHPSGGKY